MEESEAKTGIEGVIEVPSAPVIPVKVCRRCLIEKAEGEFSLVKGVRHPICLGCLREIGKESRAKVEFETEEDKWGRYMKQLYLDAIKPGAPAATRDLYAVLVGKKVEKKEIKIGLSADDVAKRNLEAQRALRLEARKELEG